MYSGSAMVRFEIGGRLSGFGMRLKPSGSRGGAWSKLVKRERIYWRDNYDSNLCISNHVSLLHTMKL